MFFIRIFSQNAPTVIIRNTNANGESAPLALWIVSTNSRWFLHRLKYTWNEFSSLFPHGWSVRTAELDQTERWVMNDDFARLSLFLTLSFLVERKRENACWNILVIYDNNAKSNENRNLVPGFVYSLLISVINSWPPCSRRPCTHHHSIGVLVHCHCHARRCQLN